jgi:hypothetical protein
MDKSMTLPPFKVVKCFSLFSVKNYYENGIILNTDKWEKLFL